MREIKFRAWDKTRIEMFFFNFTREALISSVIFSRTQITIFSDLAKDKNIELMQFTGLKDKNGVEIYEGDIFDYRGDKGSVEYCDEGAYELISKEGRFIAHLCFITSDEIEVIGNIYENGDLLK